jgi:hypothetical protein
MALDRQRYHALQSRLHTDGAGSRGDDQEVLRPIEISARVFFMHAGDRRDPQSLGFEAETPTGKTIAPGAKSGTGKENIRLQVSQVSPDLSHHGVFMLAEVAVAAHDGGDHLSIIAQHLLQESPRSKRSVLEADSRMRFLFTPQTPEKRIDIMEDTEWLSHERLL